MARKPSDVIQYKIRIREDLRRRLEQAAKAHDRSINFEIASRLAESFDLPKLDKITAGLESGLPKLDKIAAGLESIYARFAREGRDRLATQKLMTAAEQLIRQWTEARDREAVKRAIAGVQEAITAIARVHGRTYENDQ